MKIKIFFLTALITLVSCSTNKTVERSEEVQEVCIDSSDVDSICEEYERESQLFLDSLNMSFTTTVYSKPDSLGRQYVVSKTEGTIVHNSQKKADKVAKKSTQKHEKVKEITSSNIVVNEKKRTQTQSFGFSSISMFLFLIIISIMVLIGVRFINKVS